MTIPALMPASVLHGVGDVRLEEVPVPAVAADQVLIEVAAVGVCGSDVHYYQHGRIGDFVVDAPLILGHEAGGLIVEVGAEVPRSRIGERVAIEPQRADRICDQCRHGRYNLCRHIEFYATPPIDGAFARYAVIQADYAFPIPDSMSLEAAALCEPLSVGIWSNQKAGTAPGSRVLIAGAGPIGLLAAQTARAFGASRVIVSDPVAERREFALRLGATDVVDPLTQSLSDLGTEVDAFIDASGSARAVNDGIMMVAPAGRVVLVGMWASEFPLPVSRIQNYEIVLTGVFRYTNTWPIAIDLISRGLVNADGMVTGRYDLAHVEDALLSANEPTTMKSVVTPSPALS